LRLLTELDLLDELSIVFVAGDIYGSSMRRAIRRRARDSAGISVFRALDHIRPRATRASGRLRVCPLSVRGRSFRLCGRITRVSQTIPVING
jgi:hypothetical protein